MGGGARLGEIKKMTEHARARGTQTYNLTSRMGHTGQTRDIVVLGWIVEPLMLTTEKGRRVDDRVRAMSEAREFEGRGGCRVDFLFNGDDSTAA